MEVELKYRSEGSVSGRAGRISLSLLQSKLKKGVFFFQIRAKPQNLLTFSKECILEQLKRNNF